MHLGCITTLAMGSNSAGAAAGAAFAAIAGGDRQGDHERQKDTHDVSPQAERSCFSRGSLRMRLPVAAKTALASAGAVTAVPGSPIPPGFSKLRTRRTSIAGASLIRSVRTSWME